MKFLSRIITGDEIWIYYRNPTWRNPYLRFVQASEPVFKQKQFEQKGHVECLM